MWRGETWPYTASISIIDALLSCCRPLVSDVIPPQPLPAPAPRDVTHVLYEAPVAISEIVCITKESGGAVIWLGSARPGLARRRTLFLPPHRWGTTNIKRNFYALLFDKYLD